MVKTLWWIPLMDVVILNTQRFEGLDDVIEYTLDESILVFYSNIGNLALGWSRKWWISFDKHLMVMGFGLKFEEVILHPWPLGCGHMMFSCALNYYGILFLVSLD